MRRVAVFLFLLLVTGAVNAYEPQTVLGISDDRQHFTINGKPTFLFAVSYFNPLPLDTSDERKFKLLQDDLERLKRQGINSIRIFLVGANEKWGWSGGPQPETPSTPFVTYSPFVKSGNSYVKNTEYLNRMRRILEVCDRKNMIVDISLAMWRYTESPDWRSILPTELSQARSLVREFTREFIPYRNWYWDVFNEWDSHDPKFPHPSGSGYLAREEIVEALLVEVKAADKDRLCTASGNSTDSDFLSLANLDFICPHTSHQSLVWYKTYEDIFARNPGLRKPVHSQEPGRRGYGDPNTDTNYYIPASVFINDLKGVLNVPAAGWCLHNYWMLGSEDNRPVAKSSFLNIETDGKKTFYNTGLLLTGLLVDVVGSTKGQLDAVERDVLEQARPLVGHPWGMVISPAAGEDWDSRHPHTIQWDLEGYEFETGAEIVVELMQGNDLRGAMSTTYDQRSLTLFVPDTFIETNGVIDDTRRRYFSGNNFWFRIRSGTTEVATTLGFFSVFDRLRVGPVPTELPQGSLFDLTWQSESSDGVVQLAYSCGDQDPDTAIWIPITAVANGIVPGFYRWSVPREPQEGCLLRVVLFDDPETVDISSRFNIVSTTKSVALRTPNGGERWNRGQPATIAWTSSGLPPETRIKFDLFRGPIGYNVGERFVGIMAQGIAIGSGVQSYQWSGRMPDGSVPPAGNDYWICIQTMDFGPNNIEDVSNSHFTITDGGTIALLAPNGGETWIRGAPALISWTSAGLAANTRIKFDLFRGPIGYNVGEQFIGIMAEGIAIGSGVQSYQWSGRMPDGSVPPAGNDYWICIQTMDFGPNNIEDNSDGQFAIVFPRTLTVLSPNGGEYWHHASSQVIRWNSTGAISNVTVALSSDDGATYHDIASTGNDGELRWGVPTDVNCARCRVRVCSVDVPVVCDASDGSFSILPAPLPSESADFNGDGVVDLLFRFQGLGADQGRNRVWLLNSDGTFKGSLELPRERDLNWRVGGAADLDRDGVTDIFWRYYGTGPDQGRNRVWLMNADGSVKSAVELVPVADTSWRMSGAGDFDNDDVPDVLWRYYGTGASQGVNALWYLDEFGRILSTQVIADVSTAWTIVSTGDYDGDGNTDIQWRYYANGSGQGTNGFWYMDGAGGIKSTKVITAADTVLWRAVGAGDVDRDGVTDLLWRYTGTGASQGYDLAWTMLTNGEIKAGLALPAETNLSWKIVNGGDFDILVPPGPPVFSGAMRWLGAFGLASGWETSAHPRMTADVNGDGRADIVGFFNDGVYVALATGAGLGTAQRWVADFGVDMGWWCGYHPRTMADVNGDGKADVVGFGIVGVYVALSTGTSFGAVQQWSNFFGSGAWGGAWQENQHPRAVADVNGDGKADIVGFYNDGVYVATSSGTGFASPQKWVDGYGVNAGWNIYQHPRAVGDVNGDGKADVVGFSSAGVLMSLSTGNGFAPATLVVQHFGTDQSWYFLHPRVLADVNGDGRKDVVGFYYDGVYASLATGNGFTSIQKWVDGYGSWDGWTWNQPRYVIDANGDGKADVVGLGKDGVRVSLSTGTSFSTSTLVINNFGTDANAGGWGETWYPRTAADITGDGKADVVGFGYNGVWVSIAQ